jgi:hypothetical protein
MGFAYNSDAREKNDLKTIMVDNTVAYWFKAKTVKSRERKPLLANGSETTFVSR